MHHWSEAAYIMQTPEGPVGIYWEESNGRPNTAYPLPTELRSIYEQLERDYLSLVTEAREYGISMLEDESHDYPILFARCKAGGAIDWESMKHPACNPIIGFALMATYAVDHAPRDYLELVVYSSDPYGEVHATHWEYDATSRTWHSFCGGDGGDLSNIDPTKLPQGHRLQAELATPHATDDEQHEH